MSAFLAPEDAVLKPNNEAIVLRAVLIFCWVWTCLSGIPRIDETPQAEIDSRVAKLAPVLYNKLIWLRSFLWSTFALRLVCSMVFAAYTIEFTGARCVEFSIWNCGGVLMSSIACRAAVYQLNVFQTYEFSYGLLYSVLGIASSVLFGVAMIAQFSSACLSVWYWPAFCLAFVLLGVHAYLADFWLRCRRSMNVAKPQTLKKND